MTETKRTFYRVKINGKVFETENLSDALDFFRDDAGKRIGRNPKIL